MTNSDMQSTQWVASFAKASPEHFKEQRNMLTIQPLIRSVTDDKPRHEISDDHVTHEP